MSIAFGLFGWILLFTTSLAIELSLWVSIHGCGYSTSCRKCWIKIASSVLIYNVQSSTLAANDITTLIICAKLRIALLCDRLGMGMAVMGFDAAIHACFCKAGPSYHAACFGAGYHGLFSLFIDDFVSQGIF